MKAIVCVKQVPDTSGKVAVKADGTLDRASMATITNPDDLNALEAALKLKDATGCEVVVITMGPPPAEGMLRELLARGADKAVLVSGREFGGSDTFATSQILAAAVNKIGVGPEDVVFCGRQAIDGDTAQVGPQIAEKLHLPQVTYVADIQKDGNTLTVKRMLEDGYMMVKVQTPCLLTCIKELNQPRYMSVNGIFTCYDKPMEVFDYNALKDDPLIEVDTIGLKGSPTNVFKSFTPPQGKLMPTDFELVSEARKLADELNCEVTGLLLGDNVDGIAKELGGYGADKVMVCDSPLLKDYTTDAYAKVVCDMVNEYKPEVLLIGATNIGRDLGPRCAARLHTGLTADATHLDIDTAKYIDFLKESSTIDLSKQKFDMEDRNLKMTRPAFGGHLMATIICPRFRPQMSTVRPGVMKKAPFDQAKADACQIVKPAFELSAADIKTEVLSVEKAAEKLVDLIGADVIVSVGRGISKDVNKGIELAEQLAAALGGGVVGASRAVTDAGWMTADHQVGQTGKTVHPKIYVTYLRCC